MNSSVFGFFSNSTQDNNRIQYRFLRTCSIRCNSCFCGGCFPFLGKSATRHMDAFVGKVLRGRAAPSHESNLVPNKTWSRGEVQEVVWKTFQKAVNLNNRCVCMCVFLSRLSLFLPVRLSYCRLMARVLRCHRNRHRQCRSHEDCNCQSPMPKSIKVQ